MKKFWAMLAAVLTAMIIVAQPITSMTAHAAFNSTISDFSHNPNVNYYFFFAFNRSNYAYGWYFAFSKNTYNSNMISWDGNIATITWNRKTSFYCYKTDGTNYSGSDDGITSISIDFSTNTVVNVNNANFPDAWAKNLTNYYSTQNGTMDFGETFETNIPDLTPPDPLDLSFTFSPNISGTIQRSNTIDGKSYTSDTLDFTVTNNGNAAQFAMFIVPHGVSVDIPASTTFENNAGFNGSPTFALVTEEWTKIKSGFFGENVYMASAWHTVGAGDSKTYYIPWTAMNLQKSTMYQVVIYAMNIDDDSVVSAQLWDAVEYYRSSDFLMIDPAIYMDNSKQNGVYSYNGNQDMSGLFNTASAYHDDNGNLHIESQNNGNALSNINMNQAFGSFFPFVNAVLGYFPSIFLTLITFGLTAIVIIAIVKAVTN